MPDETRALISHFWEESGSFCTFEARGRGCCQCSTETLIAAGSNPGFTRAFLILGVLIDQVVYSHFRALYPAFRESFCFPKLYGHTGPVHMARPSWFTYSRYEYDERVDWREVENLARVVVRDVHQWFQQQDREAAEHFRQMLVSETRVFEPYIRGRVRTIVALACGAPT